ncbi:BTAD domain-containing putative transcriptional regulator [Actinokineospora sp. NPDC004072]
MRFGVLGPLAVWTSAGEPVAIPGVKVRAVLADLIVHDGRPVSTDRLVEDLWGADIPANPAGALQVRVSQLRKALADAEPGGRDLVVSRPPGYLLAAEPDAVDAWRFAALAARAEQAPDARTRAGLLADALALWRGDALADFADEEFARAAIARLEEQRLAVVELHAEARLELGEHSLLAGELGDLVARHPLRERLRAVHMRALYQAGRQSEALDSFADLRRRLDEEMGLEPGPELVALQQAILEQDAALAVERPARRPRTNLPPQLTELIGRESAVAELRALLADARLVTLTGPGGVGKTRLALETAAQLDFADGVWLVELAAADTVADEVLAALEIRDSDPAPAEEKLAAALSPRHALLVLDNCEHLVEPVAALAARLLRAAPGVRVLATSREPLHVPGEVVWDVPPLAVPGPDDDPAACGAVQLFVARAAAVARGFALDAGNRDAVAQLCARLDGIPLALELAATRVRALGVHGVVERLDDRFRLLTAGSRGAPARQRTLAAVIDWSWALLSAPEQAVLRRLAVHSGGCALDAAEATCSGPDVPAVEVVDLLARLVDRSLVVLADHPDGPRFRLLETVAAYCVDRLREAGELDEARTRHAAFYTDLAERAEPFLRGPEQPRWLRRLDAESANLHDALAGEHALRLANALTWYWFLRGRLTQARRALAAACDRPGPDDQRARAVVWRMAIELLQGESAGWAARRQIAVDAIDGITDPVAATRARWFLAFAENGLGEQAGTEALLARALADAERLGDRWGAAAALSTRAALAHARSDTAALGADAARSAELFQALGDRWGVLQATEWVAGLAEMTGDHEQATRLHRDGLRLAEELELWPDVAGRLSWLGWLALQLGDHTQARELCEQAMRLAAEQNSHTNLVFAELGLGFAARRAGKLDLAETHLRNLVATAKRQDDGVYPPYLSMVLVDLGYVAVARGDAAAAVELHLEALDVALAMGDTRGDAYAAEALAGALVLDGRAGLAARLLGAAEARRSALGLPLPAEERAEIDRVVAAARAALGDDRFAAEHRRGGGTGLAELRAELAATP